MYAATYETFLQAYREIARGLRLPGHDDPKIDSVDLVLKWLEEEPHKWLMILDNADNAEHFLPPVESSLSPADTAEPRKTRKRYLPTILDSQKSLFITTRNRHLGKDLAHGGLCVEAPPFSYREADQLLRLKLEGIEVSFDVSGTKRLLEILGNIPLAITQAAAFIKRNRSIMTIQGYTAALEKDQQSLMQHLTLELQDHRRQTGYPNAVFLTWKRSFDQISSQEPEAAKLLSVIAMIAPNRIPDSLLRPLLERDVDFTMAIGTLDGFALISREIEESTWSIHPLV